MPAWLDELARKEDINVSQILQQSIKKLLGVNQSAKLA
jgi:post-segregation antitoxin (ccd killing protein)